MADQWGERMPRSLSLLQTVAVSVGIAIGSGIFRVPATVAAQLHTSGPILSCWVLGGIIALCGTLTVAELAAALPRSGGIFAYLLESYGPLPAFLFGWTELVVIRAAALGAIATVFAEYLGYFVPLSAAQVRYLAAFAIVLIGSINHIGVQRAAAVQSVTTLLKYAVLAAAVVVSAFSGLNASMMTGSRVFFAMADRGLFLRAAARVSPQFNTPSVAIWLASALGVGYVLENDFAQLADKFILGIWPFYALTVGGVFMLRRRRPDLPRPYRVFGYPFVPALFLLASALMVLNALLTDPGNTAVTVLIIVAGVPAYWLRGRLWPRHSTGSWQEFFTRSWPARAFGK